MDFSTLAKYMQKIESTTKRLEMIQTTRQLFLEAEENEVGIICYILLGALGPDYAGTEIGMAEKLILRSIAKATGITELKVEQKLKEIGDLGQAAFELLTNRKMRKLVSRELTVSDTFNSIIALSKLAGKKSTMQKIDGLASVLADMSPQEGKYLVRYVTGELRLGLAEMTLLDALSEAFAGSKEARQEVESIYNIRPDIGQIALTIRRQGLEGLRKIRIEIGIPIRMQLAERLGSPQEIAQKVGLPCAIEYKYDGERIQAHKRGAEVKLFSRRLEDISHQYPDVVELLRGTIKTGDAIFEMECIAVEADTGEIRPFQDLMQRRRKYEIERVMREIPVNLKLFDVLFIDRRDLMDSPYKERRAVLEKMVKKDDRVQLSKMILAKSSEDIERFFEEAISDGMEGVMVKMLDSEYEAGARSFRWVKLKREYKAEMEDTLDLVIIGAYRGMGKRAQFKYGSFLMAIYDPESDMFKSTTRVGTGFTEQDLGKLGEMLENDLAPEKPARVDSKIEPDFWFKPRLVLEVIGAEVTISPIHTAAMAAIKKHTGLAIRFPRFTGKYRIDKEAEDATTEKELIEFYQTKLKKIPG